MCLQPVWDTSGSLRFYICTQYTGTSGIGNLVRDCGATFPSGLQVCEESDESHPLRS
jgi:hypothetical protein